MDCMIQHSMENRSSFFVVDNIESNTTSIREQILNSEFEENLEHQLTKLSKQLRYCPAFENRIDHIIFLMTDSDVIQNFLMKIKKEKEGIKIMKLNECMNRAIYTQFEHVVWKMKYDARARAFNPAIFMLFTCKHEYLVKFSFKN